jgi:hypothetical protein
VSNKESFGEIKFKTAIFIQEGNGGRRISLQELKLRCEEDNITCQWTNPNWR